MSASFSKTKHIFPLLASKCRTPWWIQGMWDDVALDYCCCFLAFPVCSLQCLQGEWVWNSAVMEQWKKSGDRFLRWECCWKNWLLSVLPACLLSYRCWLQPFSFVWLLITLCAAFQSGWAICRAHVLQAFLVWSMMQGGGLTSLSQKLFPFLWTDTGRG